MRIKLSEIYYNLLLLFLILVFSFPRILQEIKLVILFIILLIIFKGKFFNKNKYKLLLFYFFFFPLSILVAIIHGNETQYILNSFKIYYLFPLLICTIFYINETENFYIILEKSGIISICIITFSTLTTLLNGFGYFPVNINALFYEKENVIGIHEGYIHIINTPPSYYLFLIPLVFHKKEYFSVKRKEFYAFLFLAIFAFIIGRRILILPFIIVILYHFRQFYRYIIPLAILLFYILTSNSFENFSLDTIYVRFVSAINSTDDSYVREEQANYFISYIENSPIWGYGLGSYMPDYLRNDEFKTAYERSTHYLFFVLGIPMGLGVIFYYIYLIIKGWYGNLKNQSLVRGMILGIICILIASYTNPYWMSGFDFVIPFSLLIIAAANGIKNVKR